MASGNPSNLTNARHKQMMQRIRLLPGWQGAFSQPKFVFMHMVEALDSLTEAERNHVMIEIESMYCKHCWRHRSGYEDICHCENDE